jgi:hypothetical protein
MAETLSHPDAGVGPDRGPLTGASRWQKVVGILGLLVVLWVGRDTYKVIDGDIGGGGGGHGPGQEAPVENQDRETDTDDGGGGHRPPPGGHG